MVMQVVGVQSIRLRFLAVCVSKNEGADRIKGRVKRKGVSMVPQWEAS